MCGGNNCTFSRVSLPPSRDSSPELQSILFFIPVSLYSECILYTSVSGKGFPGGSVIKNTPASVGGVGLIPGLGRPLEAVMVIHSSILAWRILWTEESGGLEFMELQSQTRLSD